MKAVLNAIRVVEVLGELGECGVSELSRRTGIAKSTVQRCLLTLSEAGWITTVGPATDPGGTRWRLANRLHQLATPADTFDLRALALPAMTELRDATGDTTHLVMLEGRHVVLLERVAGIGPVQIVLPIGHRVPAHAGATGKAILAALAPVALDEFLDAPLDQLTDQTIVDPVTLRRELDQVRRDGWASNAGEWDRGIVAVAACVVIHRVPTGAVSISATPDRLPPQRMLELGPLVSEIAGRIGAAAESAGVSTGPR